MPLPLHKGRLGRGLASLIGEAPQAEQRLPINGEHRLIAIDQLRPGTFNPRRVKARAIPASNTDLPASDPVPCSISARAIRTRSRSGL